MLLTRITRSSVVLLGAALVAGSAVGLLVQYGRPAAAGVVLGAGDSLVTAWTHALCAIVLPLIVAQLYLALATPNGRGRRSRRLGLSIALVFAALLVISAVVTLAVVSGLLQLPLVASLTLPAPAAAAAAPAAAAPAGRTWIDDFVPSNIVAAASTDNLLPAILFTCVFALAVRRSTHAQALTHLASVVRDASFVIVRWLTAAAPVVVLALACRVTAGAGLTVGGVLLGYVAIEAIAVLASIALLYPLAALVGRTRLLRFARAAAPPQLIALTSRSSLATVPSLLLVAERTLKISPDVSASVIPLAGATLKLSRAVTNPAKLLFLVHVLGLAVTPVQLVVFVATILLMSPSIPGVPAVNSVVRSLPVYVAAGVPAEYVVLIGTTEWMNDMIMTVLNSTGYLTAAVLVERFAGQRRAEAIQGAQPAEATGADDLAIRPRKSMEGTS